MRNLGSRRAIVRLTVSTHVKLVEVEPLSIKEELLKLQSKLSVFIDVFDAETERPIPVNGQDKLTFVATKGKRTTALSFGEGTVLRRLSF